jgi:acyl-CoA reductase-like NAD-dependent aldehyde dehydrogenase
MAVDAQPSAAPASPPTGSKHIDARTLERLARRIHTGERERGTMEIIRPATGQPLGNVPRCTPEDVAAAVDRATRSR